MSNPDDPYDDGGTGPLPTPPPDDLTGTYEPGGLDHSPSEFPSTPLAPITPEPFGDEFILVVLGAPGVGKTNFVAACVRACSQYQEGEYRVSALPHLSGQELLGSAYETIGTGAHHIPATDETRDFAMDFVVTRAKGFLRPETTLAARVQMGDGPGADMFWSPEQAQFSGRKMDATLPIAQRARKAGALVFCLDPTNLDASCFVRQIQAVLAAITVPEPVPEPSGPLAWLASSWVRTARPKGTRRGAQYRRRLGADRVLIAILKADTLVRDFGTDSDPLSPAALAKCTPIQLAQELDPVAHIVDLIGVDALHQIRQAMRDDATLAVTFCSSWGFGEGGQPFSDREGHNPLMNDGDARHARHAAWTPFGCREALLFAVAGVVESPVEVLDLDGLSASLSVPPLPARLPLRRSE